ncbi:hypothetical protein ACRC7T_04310 [Segnochrobactraceae bacterium EtOH-i3]
MVLPFRSARLVVVPMLATLSLAMGAAPAGAQNVEVRGVNAIDFGSIDRQVDMALDSLAPGASMTIETPTRARVRILPQESRPDLNPAPGSDCRAYRYDYTHADESATLEIHGVRCRSPGGYWVMLGDEEIVRVRPRGGGAVAKPAAPAVAPPVAQALVPAGPVGIPKPNPLVIAREEAPAEPPAELPPVESAAATPDAPVASGEAAPSQEGGRVVYPGGPESPAPAPAVAVAGEPDPDVVAGLQLLRYLPPDQPASASEVGRALSEFAADEGVPPDVAVLKARLEEALSRNRMLVSCGRSGPGACLQAR